MKYEKFLYYYPPRPENKITPQSLEKYDDGQFIAQPKLNGSSCMIYMNQSNHKVYDRHKKEKAWLVDGKTIYKGDKWMVLCGEWMNKSKIYQGKKWNDKFVIWDILIYNGDYLTGSTYEERTKLLDELYGKEEYNEYLYQISEQFYRVKTFETGFKPLFDDIQEKYPDGNGLLEGLVLKMKTAKLKKGVGQKNNVLSQIKCRLSTKNYAF